MRKIILLTFTFFLINYSQAQIPNGGFENLDSTGSVAEWGRAHLLHYWFDSLGNSHDDSVIYDKGLYFSTNDANSGNRALEMRNAFNFTQSTIMIGGADLNGANSTGYGFPVFTSISQQPILFNFYYKFFPVSTDSAYALMQVFDTSGTLIGEASLDIGGTKPSYSLVSTPVIYNQQGMAAFVSISFSTARPGNPASMGTRFLVDDVSISQPGGINNIANNHDIQIYPNPAKDILYILTKSSPSINQVNLQDMTGKIIKTSYNTNAIDCGDISAGIYFIKIKLGNSTIVERVIIL